MGIQPKQDNINGTKYERAVGLPGAFVTTDGTLTIREITLTDTAVVDEACRWTRGRRGEPVSLDEAAGRPVEGFVHAALTLGACTLGYASDAAGVGRLAGRVAELTERAEMAGSALVRSASEAAAQTTDAAARASRDASANVTRTVSDAITRFEQDAARALDSKIQQLADRLDSLLGSERSEVATAIRQLVASALAEGQAGWQASAAATLAEMHRTFDTANPANPLAAVTRQIDATQQRLHADMAGKLERVIEMVAASSGVATTAAALAEMQERSPAKGLPFEEAVAGALGGVAAGMGASYERTGTTVGALRNCRKGDAIIELPAGREAETTVRILVEATKQESSRDWVPYLRDAERNRGCQVSLGIVRTARQVPGGGVLAMLGASRAVIAFDPDVDEPSLLRAAIQVLGTEGRRRVSTANSSDLGVADVKIVSARQQLADLVALHKVASGVRDNAVKIVVGLDAVHASLSQTLDQALTALHSAERAAA
jgi:hypothetical protein